MSSYLLYSQSSLLCDLGAKRDSLQACAIRSRDRRCCARDDYGLLPYPVVQYHRSLRRFERERRKGAEWSVRGWKTRRKPSSGTDLTKDVRRGSAKFDEADRRLLAPNDQFYDHRR